MFFIVNYMIVMYFFYFFYRSLIVSYFYLMLVYLICLGCCMHVFEFRAMVGCVCVFTVYFSWCVGIVSGAYLMFNFVYFILV